MANVSRPAQVIKPSVATFVYNQPKEDKKPEKKETPKKTVKKTKSIKKKTKNQLLPWM